MELKGSLARGASQALSVQVLGMIVAYGTQILLARWMTIDAFGAYEYAIAISGFLAFLSSLGLPSAVLRFIPEYTVQQKWAQVRGIIGTSWRYTLGFSSVVAIASLGVLGIGSAFQRMTIAPALLIGIATIPLQALAKLQGELARAKHRIVLAYAPLKLAVPVLVLAGAVLWQLSGKPLSSEGAIALFGGALLVILIGQWIPFWQGLSPEEQTTTATYTRRYWLWVALPMFLMDGANVLLDRTDLLMLGSMRSMEDVGIYSAATQTASWVNFPLFAVNAITAPVYAALYAQGDRVRLQQVVSMVAHWIFWVALAVALGLIIFAVPVLHLFGDEFTVARWPLVALSLGQLVNVGAGSVGYLLMMTGHQNPCARVFFMSALINVGLNAIAIPRFGLLGAALATAFSMMLWNVWLHVLVVRYLQVRPSILFAFQNRFE